MPFRSLALERVMADHILKKGTLVMPGNPTWRARYGIGRIYGRIYASNLERRIKWSSGLISTWAVDELVRICEHCLREREQHMSNGRCLFGASSWR